MHSKLVLFSFFKGGFKENYQQRKKNIGYQVKGTNMGQGGGSGSSYNCAINNLTVNKLWDWNFWGQWLNSKLKRFDLIIFESCSVQKFYDSKKTPKSHGGGYLEIFKQLLTMNSALLLLVGECCSKTCCLRPSMPK